MTLTDYLQTALANRTAIHGALLQQLLAAGGFTRMRAGLTQIMEAIGFERAVRPYDDRPGGRGGYQTNPGACVAWHIAGRPDRVYVRNTDTSGEYLTTSQLTALATEYQRSVNLPLRRGRARVANPQLAHLRDVMLTARKHLQHAQRSRETGLTPEAFALTEQRYTTARDDYHAALRARGEL